MQRSTTIDVLRTPDERFVDLPDFPFEPHYVEVGSGTGGTLRVHYLDEGPADGEVVLLLHGEPSWSYLYRKMIPVLVDAGFRAVAIDLVGFGRSDKPARREDYTYAAHTDWTLAAIKAISLADVTLVCQDWGGLIGLRIVAENPDLFGRVVAANTMLPTGDHHPGDAFLAWQKFSQEVPVFPAGQIVNGGSVSELAPEVIAAYEAPFPDDTYLSGARQFPMLVPISPDDPAAQRNREAWAALGRFEKPFLSAFSDSDPITGAAEPILRRHVPGARDQAHVTIAGGGHFLQEDKGRELAEAVVKFIGATPA